MSNPAPMAGRDRPPPLPVALFWRMFSLRHARRDWLQTLLLMAILALGVGTFMSVRMANRSAVEGFRLFTDSLRGPSDWIIETSGAGIALADLARIRAALGDIPAELYPVLERSASPLPAATDSPDHPPLQARLLGLDLVQVRSTADDAGFATGDALWELLEDPRHILITRELAGEWGVTTGSGIELVLDGAPHGFIVRGLLPEASGGNPLPRNLAVTDIAALLGILRAGAVDRVEVVIPEGPARARHVAAAGGRLQALADGRWLVSSPAGKRVDGESMTAAFRLNLTVLSLIALLTGMYLITQTLDATVSRRRGEIATLRSLGVSGAGIRRLWLAEAAVYGMAAGLLGVVAGRALAGFTVEAVTATVRALYRDTVQGALQVTAADILLSVALGLGGSLVAAWVPARDAAATPPAQFLRVGKRIPPFPLFQHPWPGWAALAVGALLLWLPPWTTGPGAQVPVAGYAASLLWLIGGTLVAAQGLRWAGAVLHRLLPDSAAARLAASRLRQPTSRHQLALSGFFVAVAMVAAMAFMIASFEHTVTGWLKHRLRADLFISSIGFQGSDTDKNIPGPLLDRIEQVQGVRALDRFRPVETRINGVQAVVAGSRLELVGNLQQLLWIRTPRPADSPPADADADGYANENLRNRAGIDVGDIVGIATPAGLKRVRIAGIHADYSSDNGLLLVDLEHIRGWYRVDDYATAAVFLEDGVDPAAMQARLREEFPGLAIRQNGELMETALFIFDQTFAVTYALQVIGLVVALAGLALSLVSLLRESARELSLQRALGMSRREIAHSTALEGTGVALAGLSGGLVLSIALGNVLIHVINRQSFGWTLQADYPVADMAALAAAVLGLGFLISFATGWLHLRRLRQEAL